jgi:hypothetical protein
MDQPHDEFTPRDEPSRPEDSDAGVPLDDDERFIVGLVLPYYRRHPERAKTRLLDLLGEVLTPTPPAPPPASRTPARKAPPADDPNDLWRRTQAGVAPLKPKR